MSALVLLLLAQLRFPAASSPVQVATTPLERLAARATYDDLAGIVGRFETTIARSLVVLRVAPPADPPPRQISDLLTPPEQSQDTVRYVPALRISATTALAAVGGSVRISVVAQTDPSATADILAADAIRRVALVRVPEGPASTVPLLPLADLQTPVYVVAVEGTRAGITLRPVFLGRADRFGDPRWDRPLLALSGAGVTAPGALIFSLDGRFIGCVVADGDGVSIAGARDVIDTVDRLAAGPSTPGDAGIVVQPLTASLAAATRTPAGVVVSDIRERGPADGVLEVGDVVTAMNGEPFELPESLLLRIAQAGPATEMSMTVSRQGVIREVRMTLAAAASVPPESRTGPLIDLQYLRGTGSAVRAVAPDTPAAAAGLNADDVIVRAGSVRAPSPAQIQRLIRQLPPGEYLLLTVHRDGRQRVLAMPAPSDTDATRSAR